MTKISQAVIMVGGKGTRLYPLTETKPKPILPVADWPCICYLIRSLAEAGIDRVIMACGYRSQQLVEALGDGSDFGIEITYSYEDEPLGTGGAMKLVEDMLDDVFVAANGDVFADIDVKTIIDEHFRVNASMTLALTPVENPCEFGIVLVDDDGQILKFKEKPKPEEAFSNLINAGVYVIDKSVLKFVPNKTFFDFSKDLVPKVMDDGGRIQGYVLHGTWMDVGRPRDLLRSNLHIASEDNGTGKVKDSSVEGTYYIGSGAEVYDSTIRDSVISKDSKISGSNIRNSLVMSSCKVTGATIRNSILGDGCIVCEGAEIIDSVLADGTEVPPNGRINERREVI